MRGCWARGRRAHYQYVAYEHEATGRGHAHARRLSVSIGFRPSQRGIRYRSCRVPDGTGDPARAGPPDRPPGRSSDGWIAVPDHADGGEQHDSVEHPRWQSPDRRTERRSPRWRPMPFENRNWRATGCRLRTPRRASRRRPARRRSPRRLPHRRVRYRAGTARHRRFLLGRPRGRRSRRRRGHTR